MASRTSVEKAAAEISVAGTAATTSEDSEGELRVMPSREATTGTSLSFHQVVILDRL